MNTLFSFVFLLSLIFGSAAAAIVIYRRQRKTRNLHPPESLRFRRGPGESLRRRSDELEERFVNTLLSGACAAGAFLGIPAVIAWIFPEADLLILFFSAILLFGASLIWAVRRCVRLLDENARTRLGRIGECVVAEALETTIEVGCRVFHDVPIQGEWGTANIDHVVVGPHGAAVVETKMRAKPSDKAPWENRVTYDGETLAWPRCPDDSKTLWQVRKNAEWLEAYFQKECGFSVPVRQVVAIPGWNVVERVLGQPRVVRGEKAGDAVRQALGADGEARFSRDQVKRLVAAMDALCRDVEI